MHIHMYVSKTFLVRLNLSKTLFYYVCGYELKMLLFRGDVIVCLHPFITHCLSIMVTLLFLNLWARQTIQTWRQSGDDLLLDPHSLCCITNIWQTPNNHDLTRNWIYPGNTKCICNAPIKFLNKQSYECVIDVLISFSREQRKRLKIFLVCFSHQKNFCTC